MQKARLVNAAKSVLPTFVVDWVRDHFYSNIRTLDLRYISKIRSKDVAFLSDKTKVEQLLLELGLNNELLYEFPDELRPFAGVGLFYWQYPNQFSRYLVLLSKLKISSYLEIGVRHGGTFIITVEYLRKFQLLTKALGIDVIASPSLREYQQHEPLVQYEVISSLSPIFGTYIADGFDLALIDGSHKEEDCRQDFLNLKEKVNILAFHDIVSDVVPGVKAVWNEVKERYAEAFYFFEFTQQYESLAQATHMSYLGIGVAVKKKYLQEKGLSHAMLSENVNAISV